MEQITKAIKKFLFKLKIKFGGLLLSILQYRIGVILFNTGVYIFAIINFIYNIPFAIFFSFAWIYTIIANWTYIKNHYTVKDRAEIKKIGDKYLEKFKPYAIHINIITWILIIFLR